MEQFDRTKVSKGERFNILWVDGVTDTIADNIGGTIRHSGNVHLVLVLQIERGADAKAQTDITEQAMRALEAVRDGVKVCRSGSNMTRPRAYAMLGLQTLRVDLTIGYWSLPCLSN